MDFCTSLAALCFRLCRELYHCDLVVLAMTSALLPPPPAFQLPDKFPFWRPGQDAAVLEIVDLERRFLGQVQPTGSGKSLTYLAAGFISGARTLILTSTKGLQTQLTGDFAEVGLVDIRGMNSYPCRAESTQDRRVTADEGPCHFGQPCSLKTSGCTYYDQVRRAQNAKLVVTNYDYWMANQRYGSKEEGGIDLGDFELLVLDEAHAAPRELADFCAININREEVEGALAAQWPDGSDWGTAEWRGWASPLVVRAQHVYEGLNDAAQDKRKEEGHIPGGMVKELRHLRGLIRRLEAVRVLEGKWIGEVTKGTLTLAPLWPAPYAERYLFLGTPKVLLTSATIRPKTLDMLGIGEEARAFVEHPSTFPVASRPVIHVPTARIDRRSTEADMRQWTSRIDQIIRARQDRKGIIHTVSYARRNLVLGATQFRDQMFSHDSHTARSAVQAFKRAQPPGVLISPSMVTGWDFPYEECEYQIIGKIGFLDTRSAIEGARHKDDKEYGAYEAMQTLVQACGRGMRAADDRCEVLVVDDHAKWFVPRNRQYAPSWFWEAWVWGNTIPRPLEKL